MLFFCYFILSFCLRMIRKSLRKNLEIFVNLRRSSSQSRRWAVRPLTTIFGAQGCSWLYWGYSGHYGMFGGCFGGVPGCSGMFRGCSRDVPGCSGGCSGFLQTSNSCNIWTLRNTRRLVNSPLTDLSRCVLLFHYLMWKRKRLEINYLDRYTQYISMSFKNFRSSFKNREKTNLTLQKIFKR